MVNINTHNFSKGMSTPAMRSNGPLPQVVVVVVYMLLPLLLLWGGLYVSTLSSITVQSDNTGGG
jgi:hypothetical protein